MRKLLIATALVTVCGVSVAGAGTLDGTAHDFQAGSALREAGTSVDQDNERLCVYCHTPHNASSDAEFANGSPPLWNKDASGSAFVAYSSGTMDSVAGAPSGVSRACLGCHDGSVAISDVNWSYAEPTGFAPGNIDFTVQGTAKCTYAAGTDVMAGAGCTPLFGLSLQTEHPVSMDYDEALPELGPLASVTVPLYGATNKVECGSCHNPHDNTNAPFLRMDNTGDALCRDCHTY